MPVPPNTRRPPQASAPGAPASTPPPAAASTPPPFPFPDPIPGVIPFGSLTLFAGAPGAGKTTLLADWCVRWRDGKTICGHPTNPPTAFYYLAVDRRWESYAPIFAAAGFADIPHYAVADDMSVSLADIGNPFNAPTLFTRCLDQLQPIPGAHVFVDPVSPLFITGNPNQQRDVARSMLGFSRRCVERQINLTCTVHFGKQKSDGRERYLRPQDRIAGSTSFAGFSDTQIYLCDQEPPHQPYYLLGWNPRHAPLEEFKFSRDAEGRFVPYREEASQAASEAMERVLTCFPTPPDEITLEALVADVHVVHGVSRRTVKRVLQQLIKETRVLRMGRGRYRRVNPA